MGRGVEPGSSRSDGPSTTGVLCNSFGGKSNFDPCWNMAQDSTKMNKLREMVENTTSATRKCVIDNILQQIAQLSDLEKFLLYLKLPMGRSPEPDPLKQPLNPLGSRSEVQLTITWIKAHLEEDQEVSLFKEDVYKKYLQYSGNYHIKHLSKADFGKVMKQVFPTVKARRLGHRGDSRYTYSGLTNKFTVHRPILPDLADNGTDDDRNGKKMPGLTPIVDNEQEKAANSIILEWAEKMCNLKCSTVMELARQLLNKSYVDVCSPSACALMSDQGSTDVSVGKHQLHRKLQEKEQKRKQQAITIDSNRGTPDRQKTRRKSGLNRTNIMDDNVTCKNMKNIQPAQMKLNVNNNFEEFVTADNKIDSILGMPASIKKEIFDVQNNNSKNISNKDGGMCSILDDSVPSNRDTGKHFASIGANGIEMNVVSSAEREGSCSNIDITNGNTYHDTGTNLHCHIEELSNFTPGDVRIIRADINDKKNIKINANSTDEFLSPVTGTDRYLRLGEIRKILDDYNVGRPSSDMTDLTYDQDLTSPGGRRKVSFQSTGGSLGNTAMIGPTGQESSLIPTVIPRFPIGYAGTESALNGQIISHGSSTNASPFMSPSTTPVQRSRHNSGQTSSIYVTPRSTPYTPDTIGQSENGTPFMSPAPTPYPRSRHNSSQNIRAPFTTASKSRHSSGTASYRHTPYQDEHFRRKARNLSGNMPLSAPMSPRGHDVFTQLTDLGSSVDVFQDVFRKSNMGIGFQDPRKRHFSADPTVHYPQQPSPGTFSNCSTNTDSLSLEVANAMSNQQPSQELLAQVGSVNRPQSVPLLQMNTVAISEVKSYPTTPLFNQQFDFVQVVSQTNSFAPKPALTDFTDFNNGSLDFSEETADANSGTTLAAINPTISTLNNPSDLTQAIPTANISFSENFQSDNATAFNREENVANFLQNVEGATFTSSPLVSSVATACPQQDSNRSSNSENSCQQTTLQKQGIAFSSNSFMTLNALNAPPVDFQSIERGFDPATITEDYSQHYPTLDEPDDYTLFEVNRE